jgi:copper chaperone
MANTVLNVKGMSCSHCVAAVTKAAESVAGVSKVKVDLKKGTAAFDYDAANDGAVEKVKAAIVEEGFEAA